MKGRVFFEKQPTIQTSKADGKTFADSRICKELFLYPNNVKVEFEDGSIEIFPFNRVKKIKKFPESDTDE